MVTSLTFPNSLHEKVRSIDKAGLKSEDAKRLSSDAAMFSSGWILFTLLWFMVGTLVLALWNGLIQHMIDYAEQIGETRSDMSAQMRKAQIDVLTRVRRSSVAYILLGPIGLLVYIQLYALLRGMYGADAACMTLRFQKPYSRILDEKMPTEMTSET